MKHLHFSNGALQYIIDLVNIVSFTIVINPFDGKFQASQAIIS